MQASLERTRWARRNGNRYLCSKAHVRDRAHTPGDGRRARRWLEASHPVLPVAHWRPLAHNASLPQLICADDLAYSAREFVEVPRNLGAVVCCSAALFGHLRDVFNLLCDAVHRSRLLTYRRGDFLNGSDGIAAALIDSHDRLTGLLR